MSHTTVFGLFSSGSCTYKMKLFMLVILLIGLNLRCQGFVFSTRRTRASLGPLQSSAGSAVGGSGSSQLIKEKLAHDMKEYMKTKQKEKLTAVRAIQAAIKQKEVDERIEVDDDIAVQIMAKLVKRAKESIKSYGDAGRQDLVDAETLECSIIESYMPAQLSEQDVTKLIDETIASLGAKTVKDMGKVMGVLRPKLTGKADMSQVGEIIKKKLTSG